MDPPRGPNRPLQRQDASDDGELPLSDDVYRSCTDLKTLPEETVYDSTSHGFIIPINFKPKPQEEEDHRSRARPVPVRPPPPPPTRGAPLLARAGSLPPPVPPRTRAPLNKQLSSDPANLLRRLNRSRTEVETYVSNPSRFCLFFFPASPKAGCSIMIHIRPVFSHQDPFTIKLIDTPQGSTKSLAAFCDATSR